MDKFIPPPLVSLISTARKNGGFSKKAFRNLPAWLIKTVLFEPLRWYELIAYRKKIREHQIQKPPIFILGYYRSGTTYLQQTLAQDQRLGYLNNFQQILPEIMLSTEGWLKPILSAITGALGVQNKMHRVKLSWDFPGEEDVAMTTAGWETGGYWGYFFPGMMARQMNKYMLFQTASEQEEDHWLNDYVYLVRKISLANKGKRLILKTPPNTARVKQLIRAFPHAHFIFIHRNPYDVFSSNKRLWNIVQEIYTIGKTDTLDVNATILESYARMTGKYLAEKHLIPAQQLFEIGYADFAADPVSALQLVYEKFQLGDFSECEAGMKGFVGRHKDYAVLKHRLPLHEIEAVNRNWKTFIDHWNYPLIDKTQTPTNERSSNPGSSVPK